MKRKRNERREKEKEGRKRAHGIPGDVTEIRKSLLTRSFCANTSSM